MKHVPGYLGSKREYTYTIGETIKMKWFYFVNFVKIIKFEKLLKS